MKTLEEMLEDHDPLVIFPWGIEEDLCLVVGDGFVFPTGFFYLQEGWNYEGGGTGTEHIVKGKISGPFPEDLAKGIRSQYWLVVNEPFPPGCIVTLDPAFFPTAWEEKKRYDLMYEAAVQNKAHSERRRGERYGSREAALKTARMYMER